MSSNPQQPTPQQISDRLSKLRRLLRHYKTTLDTTLGDASEIFQPFIQEEQFTSVKIGRLSLGKALKTLTIGDILFILNSDQWRRKNKFNERIHRVFSEDTKVRRDDGGTDFLDTLVYDKNEGIIRNFEKRQDLTSDQKQFLLAAKIFPIFANIIAAHQLLIKLDCGKRKYDSTRDDHSLQASIENISNYAQDVKNLLITGGIKLDLPENLNDSFSSDEDDTNSSFSDDIPNQVISFQEMYDRTCKILPKKDWYKSDEWYLILQDLLQSLQKLLARLMRQAKTIDESKVNAP